MDVTPTRPHRFTHLIPLFDTGLDEGRRSPVMPPIPGTRLADCLTTGRIPQGEARLIGATLAAACFQTRGLVHRDVEPSNILLGQHARVPTADFATACGTPERPYSHHAEPADRHRVHARPAASIRRLQARARHDGALAPGTSRDQAVRRTVRSPPTGLESSHRCAARVRACRRTAVGFGGAHPRAPDPHPCRPASRAR